MAKSSRSSAIKSNNQRLKKNVFGPVEAARALRLSAKMKEIAAQPKPQRDVEMEVVDEDSAVETKDGVSAEKDDTMEVDSGPKPLAKKSDGKKRIEKRRTRSKKTSIVFPKYGERNGLKKKK